MARTDHRPAGRGRGLIEKEFDGAVLPVGPRAEGKCFFAGDPRQDIAKAPQLASRTGPDDIGVICLRAGWPLRKYESGA